MLGADFADLVAQTSKIGPVFGYIEDDVVHVVGFNIIVGSWDSPGSNKLGYRVFQIRSFLRYEFLFFDRQFRQGVFGDDDVFDAVSTGKVDKPFGLFARDMSRIQITGYPLRSRIPYIWFPRLR